MRVLFLSHCLNGSLADRSSLYSTFLPYIPPICKPAKCASRYAEANAPIKPRDSRPALGKVCTNAVRPRFGSRVFAPLADDKAHCSICNLLYEWKEQYPSDFGAPGTFGAFSALLKQIISNVHLVHYGSDLLPFLEDVPTLKDADTMWAKKEDAPHLQDDDSDDGNSMFEEAYVPQARDGDDQPNRGKRGKVKASVRSSGADSQSAKDTWKAGVTTNQPVTTVSSRSRDGLPKDGQFVEGTITMNRLDTIKAPTLRVNSKELLRVSNVILTLEAHHVAQEITRRMAVMFGAIEVYFRPSSWLYLILMFP